MPVFQRSSQQCKYALPESADVGSDRTLPTGQLAQHRMRLRLVHPALYDLALDISVQFPETKLKAKGPRVTQNPIACAASAILNAVLVCKKLDTLDSTPLLTA